MKRRRLRAGEDWLRRQLEKIHHWSLVVGGLFAAVILGVIWYVNIHLGKHDAGEIILDVILFLFTVFVIFWTAVYEILREVEDVRIQLSSACIFEGSSMDVAESFGKRARAAESVRNTFVAFGLIDEVNDFSPYSDVLPTAGRAKLIERVVIDGRRTWTDIFSEEVLASNAFEMRTTIEDMQRKWRTYKARCLQERYPIINFTLIEYSKDELPEVLFGWGFHPNDKVGDVFSSRDPEIYLLFDRYWQTLMRDSVRVETLDRMTLNLQDLVGLWIDASYAREDGSIELVEIDAKHRPLDLALVEITIVEHRKIKIQGRIYHPQTSECIQYFNSRATDVRGHELWFVADSAKGMSAGSYTFIQGMNSRGDSNEQKRRKSDVFPCDLNDNEQQQSPQSRAASMRNGVTAFFGSFFHGKQTNDIRVYGTRVIETTTFPDDPREIQQILRKYWRNDAWAQGYWSQYPSEDDDEQE